MASPVETPSEKTGIRWLLDAIAVGFIAVAVDNLTKGEIVRFLVMIVTGGAIGYVGLNWVKIRSRNSRLSISLERVGSDGRTWLVLAVLVFFWGGFPIIAPTISRAIGMMIPPSAVTSAPAPGQQEKARITELESENRDLRQRLSLNTASSGNAPVLGPDSKQTAEPFLGTNTEVMMMNTIRPRTDPPHNDPAAPQRIRFVGETDTVSAETLMDIIHAGTDAKMAVDDNDLSGNEAGALRYKLSGEPGVIIHGSGRFITRMKDILRSCFEAKITDKVEPGQNDPWIELSGDLWIEPFPDGCRH